MPLSTQEAVELAQAHLKSAGVAAAATHRLTYGPPPLFDASLTRPFHFLRSQPGGVRPGPPGRTPKEICLAVDERDGRVYFRDPDGLRGFAPAIGLPMRTDALTPDALLVAYFALTHGNSPTIARGSPGVGNKEVGALVHPPRVSRTEDAALLEGWTSAKQGWSLTRHRVTFHLDGRVEVETATDQETLR